MKKPDVGPWRIGENYFIRTITHHYTGKLIAVFDREFVLSEAAWIADDGRFSEALMTGKFKEVEVYPKNSEVILLRDNILDAVIFIHTLPVESV